MSVEDYRKQIAREVERAGSRTRGAVRGAAPGPGAEIDPDTAVARLADGDAPAADRRVALQMLKQASIHSPTFDRWRPAFLEACRDAVDTDDTALRMATLEVLAQAKDRATQERLLEGLRDPDRALVSVADALALLGYDVHAEVQQVAAAIADQPPDPRARREALQVLAADPGSAERFAGLFADADEDAKVRRLAASALSALEPETFRSVARDVIAAERDAAPRTRGAARGAPETEAARARGDVVRHVQALLDLDE